MAQLALIALALLAYALVSRRGDGLGLTPPLAFALIGLGAARFGGSPPELLGAGAGVLTVAEATLVFVLFVGATEIDLSAFRKQLRLPERLLAVGFPLTFLAGWGAALWLLPSLDVATAALLAIVLTPTDAALGQAVVTNPAVPLRIRQSLNAESGFNDGLAFAFFATVLAVATGTQDGSAGGALAGEVGQQLLLGLLGVPLGAFVGWGGGRAIAYARERGWAEEPYAKIGMLALPAIAYGTAEWLGVNGFLASFAAGLLFGSRFGAGSKAGSGVSSEASSGHGDEPAGETGSGGSIGGEAARRPADAAPGAAPPAEESSRVARLTRFAQVESELLTVLVFFAFGAVLLADALAGMAWRHVGYGLLSLTAVRMVPVALSLLGTGTDRRTVTFVGWFGPRGLGSVVYFLLAGESLDARLDAAPGDGSVFAELQAAVCATVALSIVLHGVTAAFLPQVYGRAERASGELS